MKFDLDLRSSEYISAKRFHKSRAGKAVIIATVLTIPVLMIFCLEVYATHLCRKKASLDAEVAALNLKAGPLLSMIDQTEHVRNGLELAEKLTAPSSGWPSYIKKARSETPPGLDPEVIVLSKGGSMEIRGNSKTMRCPAEYRDNLEALDFTEQTALLSITKNSRKTYSFIINALTDCPEGADCGEE